jgi:hypothetical protein
VRIILKDCSRSVRANRDRERVTFSRARGGHDSLRMRDAARWNDLDGTNAEHKSLEILVSYHGCHVLMSMRTSETFDFRYWSKGHKSDSSDHNKSNAKGDKVRQVRATALSWLYGLSPSHSAASILSRISSTNNAWCMVDVIGKKSDCGERAGRYVWVESR